MPGSQPSFTIRIERFEFEKTQLAAEMDKLNGQVREANDLRVRAEETTSQLKSTLQATERDKQFFQHEVETFDRHIEFCLDIRLVNPSMNSGID